MQNMLELDLGFELPFSNKKNKGSLGEMANLGLGQGKYSMSLKHLMYQKVLKKKKRGCRHIKGTQTSKALPMFKAGTT